MTGADRRRRPVAATSVRHTLTVWTDPADLLRVRRRHSLGVRQWRQGPVPPACRTGRRREYAPEPIRAPPPRWRSPSWRRCPATCTGTSRCCPSRTRRCCCGCASGSRGRADPPAPAGWVAAPPVLVMDRSCARCPVPASMRPGTRQTAREAAGLWSWPRRALVMAPSRPAPSCVTGLSGSHNRRRDRAVADASVPRAWGGPGPVAVRDGVSGNGSGKTRIAVMVLGCAGRTASAGCRSASARPSTLRPSDG